MPRVPQPPLPRARPAPLLLRTGPAAPHRPPQHRARFGHPRSAAEGRGRRRRCLATRPDSMNTMEATRKVTGGGRPANLIGGGQERCPRRAVAWRRSRIWPASPSPQRGGAQGRGAPPARLSGEGAERGGARGPPPSDLGEVAASGREAASEGAPPRAGEMGKTRGGGARGWEMGERERREGEK